jgi:hypothetical protein
VAAIESVANKYNATTVIRFGMWHENDGQTSFLRHHHCVWLAAGPYRQQHDADAAALAPPWCLIV